MEGGWLATLIPLKINTLVRVSRGEAMVNSLE
jgi:hypothetical protein